MDQEKLIEFYTRNEKERLNTQYILHALSEKGAYYIPELIQTSLLQKPKWFGILKPLSICNLLALILIPFLPVAFLTFLGITSINFVIHFSNKARLIPYLRSFPQLYKLLNVVQALGRSEELREDYDKVRSSLKDLKKLKSKLSLLGGQNTNFDDLSVLGWALFEIIKICFLLEPIFLFSLLSKLESKKGKVTTLINFIGIVDTAISIASIRRTEDIAWCHPSFINESKTLLAKDVYHPLLPLSIKNSIELKNNSVLITGSNMSGKTTFIRAIGLNFLSGSILNTCFATSFSYKPGPMYSAIRINDDLMNDKSYYLEEVTTIKEMIEKSKEDEQCIFFLDELFKGTNTIERIAAGKAVLTHLNAKSHLVFISTHDIELSELLDDSFKTIHFTETVENLELAFDYKIKKGPLRKGNAIKLLAAKGYPKEVIKEAYNLADEMAK